MLLNEFDQMNYGGKCQRYFFVTLALTILKIGGISGGQYCPALSLHFEDFGIDWCKASFATTNYGDIVDLLKNAKCLGWGQWELLPSIGCSSPHVPEGTALKYPCHCDLKGTCEVICHAGYSLVGKNYIECSPNGTWSNFPECVFQKCPVPVLPDRVIFVNGHCDSLEGSKCSLTCSDNRFRIVGRSYIECHESVWSIAPKCLPFCRLSDISNSYSFLSDCQGNPNEICALKCANPTHTLYGEPTIVCQKTGSWGVLPICGCNNKSIPTKFMLTEPCSYAAGVQCKATCASSYYHQGSLNFLHCDQDGIWNYNSSIVCFPKCTVPPFSDGVVMKGVCDFAIGETCQIMCSDNSLKQIGPNSFHCLPSGEYSKIGSCAKEGHCSPTAIPTDVKFTGECSSMGGTTCPVQCKDSTSVLEGSQSITCTSSGEWSTFPSCVKYCPEPSLTANQQGSCTNKKGGETCNVTCLEDNSSTMLKCLLSGEWEEPPTCSRKCGNPVVGSHVIAASTCAHDVNSTCLFSCQGQNRVIVPTNRITCLDTRLWSNVPECKRMCTFEELPPEFKFVNCSVLFESGSCTIACNNEKKILTGPPVATCLSTGELFIPPSVTCAAKCFDLSLPLWLEPVESLHGCQYMDPGQSCHVKCTEELSILVGSDKITCLGDNRYSPFPTCESQCHPPKLPIMTHIVGSCSYVENSKCTVQCDHRKYNEEGKEYFSQHAITCERLEWRGIPTDCVKRCPPLQLSITVRLQEDCPYIANTSCEIFCKSGGVMFGPSSITCNVDGQWEEEPTYCAEFCEEPNLPHGLQKKPGTECTYHKGSQCKMECETPLTLVGDSVISCDSSGRWSVLPKCEALCPPLDPPLSFATPCSRAEHVTCEVQCLPTYEPTSPMNATCINGTWNVTYCKLSTGKCSVPSSLALKNPDCDMAVGSTCDYFCPGGTWTSMSPIRLTCKGSNKMDPPAPECTPLKSLTCGPPPNDEAAVVNIHTCPPPYPLFHRCPVNCKDPTTLLEGPDVIVCEPTGWSPLPKCVKTCKKYQLPSHLYPIEDSCDVRQGRYCDVRCTDTKMVIDPNQVSAYCDDNYMWTKTPDCIPHYRRDCLSSEPSLNESVFSVRREIHEEGLWIVDCIDEDLTISNGGHAVTCNEQGKWLPELQCVPETESGQFPHCPHQNGKHTCGMTSTGSYCTFLEPKCVLVPGKHPEPIHQTSICLSSGKWSPPMPPC